jgi:excinuclease ABC subunit A
MKSITIKNANLHNLKNVSTEIPLNKLVAVVGPSGSGKTSLIYDLLYKSSPEKKSKHITSKLPKTYAIEQKTTIPKNFKMSLGEYNLQRLDKIITKIKKGELLIVDEPCAGLTSEESIIILNKLKELIKRGRSVIAIEHSKEIIKGADYIIEFGPKSGKYGGEITFQGNLIQFKKSKSITADYVFSNKAEVINYKRNPTKKTKEMQKQSMILQKINKNNLQDYTLNFPLGSLVCIHGKSGTGKSTILNVVYSSLFKGLNAWRIRETSGVRGEIIGKQNIRRSYMVTQAPISNHATSRPATYLGIWDNIRDIYANIPESKKLKLKKSNFIVTKNILENKEKFPLKVLSVKYKSVNIEKLLTLTIDEAIEIFTNSKLVKRKLKFLQEVGLGYLTLGQKSDSLSGGEAQRIRLAKVLSKKLGDRCIYILDTPTKGLHLSDLPTLIKVLQKIIDKNNTVLIADNKTEIINNSDCTIDMNNIS